MKKTISLFLLLFTFATITMAGNDKLIAFNELPKVAREFIQKHFPDTKASYVKLDNDFMEKTYEVQLTDGTKIDFNSNGEWKEVDCQAKAIPDAIIPVKILTHVKTNYPNLFIQKIEKDSRKIEVELSNDLDLKFNKNGDLIEID